MRHTKISALALSAAALAFASSASADLLFYDWFNYPDQEGMNLSATPNYGHSGGSTEPVPQSGGSLSYPDLGGVGDPFVAQYDGQASGVAAHQVSTGITDGTVYFSLLFKVPTVDLGTGTAGARGFSTGSNLINGSFLAGLDTVSPTTTHSGNPVASALLIRSGDGTQTADTYQLGVSNTTTTADRTWYGDQANPNSSTNFTTGANAQTLFVVVKYTFGDSVKLFVNPTISETEPAAQLTAALDSAFVLNSGIQSMFLRNNSVEPDVIQIDELRVGTTWIDVIPEPSSGLAMCALGGFALGRCRRLRAAP